MSQALNGDDQIEADSKTYNIVVTAIKQAMVELPPHRQPPPPGSDDYTHGEKLANGAMDGLSFECQALLNNDFVAPASCAEAVREANRASKAEYEAKEQKIAEMPSIQFCLGLDYDVVPEKRAAVASEAFKRIQVMSDDDFGHLGDCASRVRTSGSPIIQYCLELKRTTSPNPFDAIFDEDRIQQEAMLRLRAMEAGDWAKVSACGKRVAAAGGLMAVDPAGEMERVNRIPAVQTSSKQYSDCAIGQAVQMAKVSKEPADTIARAALGGCALLRQQYLVNLARELSVVLTPERAAEEEKETTGAIIERVIAARAAQVDH